jgi:amidase
VGLISRRGIIPITADQDTAGPMARDVASAAIMLGAMRGYDPKDPATNTCLMIDDYTPYLDPDALDGARIGVPEYYYSTLNDFQKAVMDDAIDALVAAGATVDFVAIPSQAELNAWGICASASQNKGNDSDCSVVLKYGCKRDFNNWLATLGRKAPVQTLGELVAFNEANADKGAIMYGQARLEISDEMDLIADFARYQEDRAYDILLTATNGIDPALAGGDGIEETDDDYDALLFPSSRGAGIAARPGYPSVTVPFGFVPNLVRSGTPPWPAGFEPKDSPYGVTFTGLACSEPELIRLAFAFEQATLRRVPPDSAPPLPKSGKKHWK